MHRSIQRKKHRAGFVSSPVVGRKDVTAPDFGDDCYRACYADPVDLVVFFLPWWFRKTQPLVRKFVDSVIGPVIDAVIDQGGLRLLHL